MLAFGEYIHSDYGGVSSVSEYPNKSHRLAKWGRARADITSHNSIICFSVCCPSAN
jgi:hypothetical protein